LNEATKKQREGERGGWEKDFSVGRLKEGQEGKERETVNLTLKKREKRKKKRISNKKIIKRKKK